MNKNLVLLILLTFLLFLDNSYSQTTLYSENFGNGTTLPAGWSSSTGWAANNTTTPLSGGYTGASGGTQVIISNVAGILTYNNNLSTVGYSNITIIFGGNRSANMITSSTLQWSSNGTIWNTVTYTDVTNNAVWALVNGGTAIALPAGASGVANLQFRWNKTATTGIYKLDDVKIQGTCNPINISSITANPDPVSCGNTSTLTATSTGNLIRWYLVSTGGIPIGSTSNGVGINVTPADTTQYYAEAYNGSCVSSSRTSVIVIVTTGIITNPTNINALPSVICQGNNSVLTASTIYGGIKWWDASTGGNLLGSSASGSNFYVSPTSATTYFAEAYAVCGMSLRISLTVDIDFPSVPIPVFASPDTVTCGSSTNLNATSSYRILWYDAFSGGNIIGSSLTGIDFQVYPTTSPIEIFYAETQSIFGCQGSSRVPDTVYITGIPSPPVIAIPNPQRVCMGQCSSLSAGCNSGVVYWWDSLIGGNLLGSSVCGANFIVNPTITTIYFSETNLTCGVSATRIPDTVFVGLSTPVSVDAIPSIISCGTQVNLSASSNGDHISWYNVSSGGTTLGTSSNGMNYYVNPINTTTYYAEAALGSNLSSQTFSYVTSSIVSWTVPAGVNSITIDARGASGGYTTGTTPGYGSRMVGTFSVTVGSVLSILVGQSPGNTSTGGYTYPAGGGGTFVALGASNSTATPMIIAGGGGGSYSGGTGINASITTSGTGANPGTNGNGSPVFPTGNTCGGGGGGYYSNAADEVNGLSFTGGRGFQQGGAGGFPTGYTATYQKGGFGGGAVADYNATPCWIRAGSGGGYSGGSADQSTANKNYGEAGGSYNGGTNQINTAGYNSGNGQVIISWTPVFCVSSSRTSVEVTVNLPDDPFNVEAISSVVSCGIVTGLNAYVTSGIVRWWSAVSGGTLIGTSQSGVDFYVQPFVTTIYYAESYTLCPGTNRIPDTITVIPLASPTSVFASPQSYLCGSGQINLSGVSATSIAWYDSPSGGIFFGTSQSTYNFPVVPDTTTTYYAEAVQYFPVSQTFSYTGALQLFIIPSDVNVIDVDVYGASGGYYDTTYGNGGFGGRVQSQLIAITGQTLNIFVGGKGTVSAGGWNGGGCGTGCNAGYYGGGGGGATDIRIGGTALASRVIVGGGGGGAAYYTSYIHSNGGTGGNLTGGNGSRNGAGVYNATYCGAGGSQTAGGVAATYPGTPAPTPGILGAGGTSSLIGGYGGGGGGGGYYGGGAGASSGGGGGGSSYANTNLTSNVTYIQGIRYGDGQLIVSWNAPLCYSAVRISVTVTVIPPSNPINVTASPAIISCGSTTNLNATSSAGIIKWWDSPIGGNMVGTSQSMANFTIQPSTSTIYYAESFTSCASSQRISVSVIISGISVPSSISANPSTVACGIFSGLSAVTSSGVIRWWDASTGGNLFGSTISGAILNIYPQSSSYSIYYAEVYDSGCSSPRIADTVFYDMFSYPSLISATPSVFCQSGTSNLSAVSTGNIIGWWDALIGGNKLGSTQSGNMFIVNPSTTTTYYAEYSYYVASSQTFNYTGTIVNWTIPANVNSLTIDARGASGGYYTGATPGFGARMIGTFSVLPGSILSILVGQSPGTTTGYPGGGGGSFVGLGSLFSSATPLIVAGGGGGTYNGGSAVNAPITPGGTGTYGGINGNGATSAPCGGGGGGFYTAGATDQNATPGPGGQGYRQGGTAGAVPSGNFIYQTAGFGGGACAAYDGSCYTEAGAGGGYSGGGGGSSTAVITSGQAGGSFNGGTNQTNTAGFNNGNGQVIISWNGLVCTSGSRASVTVYINTLSNIATSATANPSAICPGNSSNLGITGGSLGTYSNWQWYSVSCGLTYEGAGAILTVSPTTNKIYFIRAEGPCNTTLCKSVTVTINKLSISPTLISDTNDTLILGNAETLSVSGGTLGSDATWYWYLSSCGGIFVGSGSSLTVSPVINTTFYVRAEGLCNTTGCATQQIFVKQGYTVSGYFSYDQSNIPLDSVRIYLKLNGNTIDSIRTDLNGYYQFDHVLSGRYNIIALTGKPWSGVNSTDAVKVKRHFAGSEFLTTSLRLHAADVNFSYNINTTDAVKITRRFVGSDTIFTRGDWDFEKPLGGDTLNVSVPLNDSVILQGSNVSQDFRGICIGDVNGSNLPTTGAKSLPKIKLDFFDFMRLSSNESFELPIISTSNLNVGAISMILKYQKNLVEIINVQLLLKNENINLVYNILGDELRIGWYANIDELLITPDVPILVITGKTTNDFKSGNEIKFGIANNPLSEIADGSGNPLDNVILTTYSIKYFNNNIRTVDLTNL